jgi:hypothetical protein
MYWAQKLILNALIGEPLLIDRLHVTGFPLAIPLVHTR